MSEEHYDAAVARGTAERDFAAEVARGRRMREEGPNRDLYVEMDGLPDEAWSNVAPGLWVGGMRELGPADPASLSDFDAAWTFDPRPLKADGDIDGGTQWLVADLPRRFDDSPRFTETVLAVWASAVRGDRTLVRCWAGLNRSSLFAVSALVLGGGADPRRAIERIRDRRHHGALNNPAYVDHLLTMSGPLPGAAVPGEDGPVDPAEGLR